MKINGELQRKLYEILLKDEKARNSDMYLYFEYIKSNGEEATRSLMENPGWYGLSNFESVSRARRKLQQKDRESNEYEIQSDAYTEKLRAMKEQEYRARYRGSY